MINYKHNLIVNLKIFLRTLWCRNWLEKEGYAYDLFNTIFKFRFDYEKFIQDLKTEMHKYEPLVNQSNDYKVYLTKFGTYGSYDMPNKIYINIYRPASASAKTIIHEMVHLEVEPIVQQKKMTHDEKENLVDEIVNEKMTLMKK